MVTLIAVTFGIQHFPQNNLLKTCAWDDGDVQIKFHKNFEHNLHLSKVDQATSKHSELTKNFSSYK